MRTRHGLALSSIVITLVTAASVFFRLNTHSTDRLFSLWLSSVSLLPFALLVVINATSCKNTLAAILASLGTVTLSGLAVYLYFINLDPFALPVLPYILSAGCGVVALLVVGVVFLHWLFFPPPEHNVRPER